MTTIDCEPRQHVVDLGAHRALSPRQEWIAAKLQRGVAPGAVGEARAHEHADVRQLEVRIAAEAIDARANSKIIEVIPRKKRREGSCEIGTVRYDVAAVPRNGGGGEERGSRVVVAYREH